VEVSGQLHTLATSLPRKVTLLLTGRKVGWALDLVWTWWQRGKFLPLPGIEPQSSNLLLIYTEPSCLNITTENFLVLIIEKNLVAVVNRIIMTKI
jgi:hypothetical protein